MKRLHKFIIKELLLYWFVASCFMLLYSYLINSTQYKILSIVSLLASKFIFDRYTHNLYYGCD